MIGAEAINKSYKLSMYLLGLFVGEKVGVKVLH
jgi:hypothetical protein